MAKARVASLRGWLSASLPASPLAAFLGSLTAALLQAKVHTS
ncbi:hypothetical protein BH09PSE5_BH09PSE5_41440 [soil metagenome]